MIVELDNTGTVVLAQDAVYLQENIDDLVLSTNVWDPHAMISSYRRLRDHKRRGTLLIPGHDIVLWRGLKHAPDWYE